jgi:hypothetical protein
LDYSPGNYFCHLSETPMTLFNPWGRPEYNENEVNLADFYREMGRREERQTILKLMRDSTKKPSAAMVKIMERIENADLDRE